MSATSCLVQIHCRLFVLGTTVRLVICMQKSAKIIFELAKSRLENNH